MLELVELTGQGHKKPTQLSGGQQQRVALARALINKPEVLLLDEPLGALDLKLRRQMQIELKRIQVEVGLTFVHVTHDQEEAMTMADTIAVMNKGVIEQMGAPAELYENPRTTFVANFLGQSNLIAGDVVGIDGDRLVVDIEGTKVAAARERASVETGRVWVGVRPEKVFIAEVVRRARRRHQHAVRRRSCPTSASSASARSTSSGCPGARSSRSSSRTPARVPLFAPGHPVDLHWNYAPRVPARSSTRMPAPASRRWRAATDGAGHRRRPSALDGRPRAAQADDEKFNWTAAACCCCPARCG